MAKIKQSPEVFIIDLDGVFTDGKFYYNDQGKVMKVFSVDDHDALSYLGKFIKIQVITADSKGIAIARQRIEKDMGLPLEIVPAQNRVSHLSSKFDLSRAIYMGDGIFDFLVFKEVMYSICPINSLQNTINHANFITKSKSGERAVAEGCTKILEVFFPEHNIFS